MEVFMEVNYVERAKHQIKFWSLQQDKLKKQYREGSITKEDWLSKHKTYRIKIEAVQSVFRI